jgi:hypothetical protein
LRVGGYLIQARSRLLAARGIRPDAFGQSVAGGQVALCPRGAGFKIEIAEIPLGGPGRCSTGTGADAAQIGEIAIDIGYLVRLRAAPVGWLLAEVVGQHRRGGVASVLDWPGRKPRVELLCRLVLRAVILDGNGDLEVADLEPVTSRERNAVVAAQGKVGAVDVDTIRTCVGKLKLTVDEIDLGVST